MLASSFGSALCRSADCLSLRFLLKEEAGAARDAVGVSGLRSYGVRGLNAGTLFLRRTQREEPEWLAFLRPHLSEEPRSRTTASLSALLVFQLDGRWFAVAFGYGRMLLDPEMIVSDFGLRAALNSVDPDQLHSIDAKTLEEVTLNTRRQLSRGSSITTFELDLHRDLVKAVRGKSIDAGFADQVAGSAALRITGDITFADISIRARDALRLYRSTAYRRRFGWIDQVRVVSDPAKHDRLDRRLRSVACRGGQRGTALSSGAGDPDEEDFGGFSFSRRKARLCSTFAGLITSLPSDLSLLSLKRDRISSLPPPDSQGRSGPYTAPSLRSSRMGNPIRPQWRRLV